ncbi:MAG: oligosaccharide flippase family protein [Chitinophagales bacterium]|nr:oligosaccharide flippase family protein [Chitinophagales bacterium]
MKREFIINILFLLAVNLLIKPFYLFGIDRGVQNTVPPEDYGLYFALFNFTFLFQIVTDFGIQNFNNRNLSQHRQLLDKYLPNMLMLKGLLAISYLILVLATAWLAGYQASYYYLLFVIAINQVLSSLLLYLRTNVSGLGMYRIDSLLSVTDRLLLIAIVGILLWTPHFQANFQIEWFVYAQTFALGSTALLAFFIAFRKLKYFRLRLQAAFLWMLLRKSWPYALAVFLMSTYNRIDGVMLERLLVDGKLEANIYASAYRLFEAGNMIGFLFASLLLPIFSRMLKTGETVDELVEFSSKMILAGALILVSSTAFHHTAIMEALYVSGSAYSGRVLLYLLASFVAVSGTYILGTLLVANDNLKQLNYVFVGGLLLNIILNISLIPSLKAEGAAMATCATQWLVFLAEIYLSYRLLRIHLSVKAFTQLLLFFVFTLLIAYCLKEFFNVYWFWQFLATVMMSGVLAFLLKLIDLNSILMWRKK